MLFQALFLQASDKGLLPTSLWILIILALVILLARAYFGPGSKEETTAQASQAVEEERTPQEPDDLTKIEGIGPKTSSVFQEAGVTTFAQLAGSNLEDLKMILKEAGLRLGDPTTWAEQAQLAANSEWEALEKLQDELKGGKRN